MPDSRPLSEIAAETRKALERIEGLRWAIDRPALARLEAAHDQALKARKLLAELSGRLDDAVEGCYPFRSFLMHVAEADYPTEREWRQLRQIAAGTLEANPDPALLCGRPSKETK